MFEDLINTENLFCDKYKSVVLYEHLPELKLLKELISIIEESVTKKNIYNSWSHDGICYIFANTIVEYSKMAYDNLIIGHFDVVSMINRAICENLVCMEIIFNDKTENLWKYYLVHSHKKSLYSFSKEISKDNIEKLNKLYIELDIENEFYEKRGKKSAYIDLNYGWTYKCNPKGNFTFRGICDLVDKRFYDDFKFLSYYSHGTNLYTKILSQTSIDHIMNMISLMYILLYRLSVLFCLDNIDDSFYEITECIETILYNYVYEF